eukprot:Colp12_sorted_trinity150504_noHs@33024
MPGDVVMAEAADATATKIEAVPEVPVDPKVQALADIASNLSMIERSVLSKETRYLTRVLRSIHSLRKKISKEIVEQASTNYQGRGVLLPECDIYLHLLKVLVAIDSKDYKEAETEAANLIEKTQQYNRRTADPLTAKCYFYYARTVELTQSPVDITSKLHALLRTATLRRDYDGQATLINTLLRKYLLHNQYDQADKLVSKATFHENASNNEWARYLYYLGRIKAIQLDYSEALKHLNQALRKAPQYTAVGFKQTVHKLAIIVQLLLGEIPDRATFRHPEFRRSLAPYLQFTRAVLVGDLPSFNAVIEKYADKFKADNTYTLILRLRHNVIKTGVRMINLSYSRISLADISSKLKLDSPEDAEYIVAKAIRDGVIDAVIDHEKGFVQSKDIVDVYSTEEPQGAFHNRITFCLNLYNESIKAMRFPPNAYRHDLETAEERREREQQEKELANEIADDDEDF